MTRELQKLDAMECNIKINGWDLECIITALKDCGETNVDIFDSTTKHMLKLSKILDKRKTQISKSYRKYESV